MRLVACYNCERPANLDGSHNQRCPSCYVVLAPTPAWVIEAGWPERSIPRHARRRLRTRNAVAVKHLYFRTTQEHQLRQRLEAIAEAERLPMNALLLSLLEAALQNHAEARS